MAAAMAEAASAGPLLSRELAHGPVKMREVFKVQRARCRDADGPAWCPSVGQAARGNEARAWTLPALTCSMARTRSAARGLLLLAGQHRSRRLLSLGGAPAQCWLTAWLSPGVWHFCARCATAQTAEFADETIHNAAVGC